MTDTNKSIKFQMYIRNQLKKSEDIDKTVEELIKQFKIEQLYEMIIDIYTIIKADKINNTKKYYYDTFYKSIIRKKKDKQLFETLLTECQEKKL